MARFRKGMRVKYRGQTGTVGGSVYDEETGKYSRYVLLDGESFEDLIDVRKLQPLSPAEWFDELLDNERGEMTEQRLFNILRNLPKKPDVTRPPKYRGIPIRPYRVKEAEQLSLFDDSLADQV